MKYLRKSINLLAITIISFLPGILFAEGNVQISVEEGVIDFANKDQLYDVWFVNYKQLAAYNVQLNSFPNKGIKAIDSTFLYLSQESLEIMDRYDNNKFQLTKHKQHPFVIKVNPSALNLPMNERFYDLVDVRASGQRIVGARKFTLNSELEKNSSQIDCESLNLSVDRRNWLLMYTHNNPTLWLEKHKKRPLKVELILDSKKLDLSNKDLLYSIEWLPPSTDKWLEIVTAVRFLPTLLEIIDSSKDSQIIDADEFFNLRLRDRKKIELSISHGGKLRLVNHIKKPARFNITRPFRSSTYQSYGDIDGEVTIGGVRWKLKDGKLIPSK